MEAVFIVLAVLLLAQSLAALAMGLRLARYVWRTLSTQRERYVPKVAVIVPCKGIEPDFEDNIIAYLAQDYRHYELIFVTESEDDSAHLALKRILHESNRSAWLITREGSPFFCEIPWSRSLHGRSDGSIRWNK